MKRGQDGMRPIEAAYAQDGIVEVVAQEPMPVDAALAAAGVSKGERARLAAEEKLLVQGRPARLADTLGRAEPLRVVLEAPAPSAADAPTGAEAPASVLVEDPFLLVADKPRGILVHSDGVDGHEDTLTARVRLHLVQEGRPDAAQAVQRLDVDTSGCTLFSLVPAFQAGLDALVAGHAMRKLYLAVVRGALPQGRMRIDAPLGRDRHDAKRMRVSPSGKDALTTVTCLLRGHGLSLALVELGSGRRHQIRVHLASRGYPVLGDPLYGVGGAPALKAPGTVVLDGRQESYPLQLHCWRETFVHPVTGERVSATAPVPESFNALFGGSSVAQALARWEKEKR